MRQVVIPISASANKRRKHDGGCHEAKARDLAAPANGCRILHKYRSKICTFHGELQGARALVRLCTPLGRGRRLPNGTVDLDKVVRQVKPPTPIAASSVDGSFTESIEREMATHTARPIIAFSMAAAKAVSSLVTMWQPEYRRIQAS